MLDRFLLKGERIVDANEEVVIGGLHKDQAGIATP